MNLLRTSVLSGVAVIVKMLTMLGINKILAVYVGPSGYAVFGQLQNAIQMITMIASGAVNNGVIKYTSEYANDAIAQEKVWRTAGTLSIFCSGISSFTVFIFRDEISIHFLNSNDFSVVFVAFSLCLMLFVLNTLFLALLNAKREIKSYVVCNIMGSVFSLFITIALTIKFEMLGALISLATYQSFSFFVTFFTIYKKKWFKLEFVFGRVDKDILRKLLNYSIMSLVSAICIPISNIMIRNHIGYHLGWEEAGYWEAMQRLSSAFLLLISSTFSVYFLPKLSSVNSKIEIRHEIFNGLKLIFPLVCFGAALIFLLRVDIINFLFTSSFLPMQKIFAFQLIGDVIKSCSLMLGYLILSKAMVKAYVISEVSISIIYYCLISLLSSQYGLEGLGLAYMFNYMIHLSMLYYFIKKENLI